MSHTTLSFYIKVPNAMPSKSCINIIPATDIVLILLCAVLRTIIVSIYAKGSLLPLSSSKREAVLYFKFKCLSRSIAKRWRHLLRQLQSL